MKSTIKRAFVAALPLALMGAQVAFAQGTTTPGVPSTGAGGDAVTSLLLIAVLGVVLVTAAVYLFKREA